MRTKAQIQQVFIYLSALLVIGFLVVFGYQMIHKVSRQQCEVGQQNLLETLRSSFDRSSRYGSISELRVLAPCDYDQLCIVDSRAALPEYRLLSSVRSSYPLIWANAEDDVKYNLYLVQTGGEIKPLFFDKRLLTTNESNPDSSQLLVCFHSRAGEFRIWAEGLGKTIYLFKKEAAS